MIDKLERFLSSSQTYFPLNGKLYLHKNEVRKLRSEILKFHIRIEMQDRISPLEKLALRMLYSK